MQAERERRTAVLGAILEAQLADRAGEAGYCSGQLPYHTVARTLLQHPRTSGASVSAAGPPASSEAARRARPAPTLVMPGPDDGGADAEPAPSSGLAERADSAANHPAEAQSDEPASYGADDVAGTQRAALDEEELQSTSAVSASGSASGAADTAATPSAASNLGEAKMDARCPSDFANTCTVVLPRGPFSGHLLGSRPGVHAAGNGEPRSLRRSWMVVMHCSSPSVMQSSCK